MISIEKKLEIFESACYYDKTFEVITGLQENLKPY